MGGKTLIGGTAYEITGGKTLVGGTSYSISGGKTLIDGTAKEISFGKNRQKFVDIMSTMTAAGGNSQNASTVGTVKTTFADGRYAFVFCDGHMSIWRTYQTATNSICLFQTSSTVASLYLLSKSATLSNDGGTSGSAVYEGSIQQWTRGSTYTEAEVDECFRSLKYISSAGNNTSAGGTVELACPASSLLIGTRGLGFSIYYPASTRQVVGRQTTTISYSNGVAAIGSTGRGSLIRLG